MMNSSHLKSKPIEAVIAPPSAHMVGDGFLVHGFMPGGMSLERMSPFILLDYMAKYNLPPSDGRPKGVGVHPHRGFETVTLVLKGEVSHHDSAGHSGTISEGDVQWMTAASGVLHKEYHSERLTREGGILQFVQLWVNLPAKDKMSEPAYQALLRADMGRVELPGDAGAVTVIAGEYQGTRGPASTHTPLHIHELELRAGSSAELEYPATYNTAMLMLDGEADINGASAPESHLVLFENEGAGITVTAAKDCKILVLSGEPIEEPIAQHGPFVMNTHTEIRQAMEDYNAGKFGNLDD